MGEPTGDHDEGSRGRKTESGTHQNGKSAAASLDKMRELTKSNGRMEKMMQCGQSTRVEWEDEKMRERELPT